MSRRVYRFIDNLGYVVISLPSPRSIQNRGPLFFIFDECADPIENPFGLSLDFLPKARRGDYRCRRSRRSSYSIPTRPISLWGEYNIDYLRAYFSGRMLYVCVGFGARIIGFAISAKTRRSHGFFSSSLGFSSAALSPKTLPWGLILSVHPTSLLALDTPHASLISSHFWATL